jgi:uncharacterized protein YkwD
MTISNDVLIDLHNQARAKSWFGKIHPLEKDDRLMEYAQKHAEWMASNNRMIHSSMRKIMKLGFSVVGENIAWGQSSEKSVVNAWLWSPGHRFNIMGRSYTKIGCGYARDKNNRIYWCVCFGRD